MQLNPFSNVTSSPFRMTFPLQEVLAHASWERARLKITNIVLQGNRVVLVVSWTWDLYGQCRTA